MGSVARFVRLSPWVHLEFAKSITNGDQSPLKEQQFVLRPGHRLAKVGDKFSNLFYKLKGLGLVNANAELPRVFQGGVNRVHIALAVWHSAYITCLPLQALAEAWTLVGCRHPAWEETSFTVSSTCTCTRTYTFLFHWHYIYIAIFIYISIYSYICLYNSNHRHSFLVRIFAASGLGIIGRHRAHILWEHCLGCTPAADNKLTIFPSHIHRARQSTARMFKFTVWLVGVFVVGASCVLCHLAQGCTYFVFVSPSFPDFESNLQLFSFLFWISLTCFRLYIYIYCYISNYFYISIFIHIYISFYIHINIYIYESKIQFHIYIYIYNFLFKIKFTISIYN